MLLTSDINPRALVKSTESPKSASDMPQDALCQTQPLSTGVIRDSNLTVELQWHEYTLQYLP